MESRFELHEKAPDHSKLQSLDTSCESFKFQEFPWRFVKVAQMYM